MEWLTTYLVHSTALIAAIWLLTSAIPKLSLGTREMLWKVALLGPLLTTTVLQLSGVPSVWGPLAMPHALRSEPTTAPATVQPSSSASVATSAPVIEQRIVRHRTGELEITAIRQRDGQATVASASALVPAAPQPASPWPLVLLGLWAAGAAVAVGRLAWAAHRLRKQLQGRRDVIEDPVLESFLDLCSKAELKKRPRLTASAHLRSPIALGHREIVLPERAVDSLTPLQQHGMLAHELAHLLRRDPLWTLLVAVVEAVFFFQPLNHLARRKIQEVAEFQCDDWAARQAGTGVHLAKCLAEVATWVEDGPPLGPVVTAMADHSSPIVRRITRLLHERRHGGRVHPAGRVAITVGTLALVIALVPGVSQAEGGASVETAGPMLAAATGSATPHAVSFEDRSDGRHDRSRVRVHAGGEIVEIEVQAPRNLPPLPPAPPPPPPRGDRLEIRIHGHFGGPVFPWGWGGGWLGMLELEELEELGGLGGLELLLEGDVFEDEWLGHERAERARERAERHHERMRERAETHADAWSGLFGVSWDGEPPEEAQVYQGVIEL